jgi:DNA-binding transcriptional LysR family regulator
MQIDPRLLEAFRSVLDSGSITQAALSLGLTQPAVSAQIARLESDIGFALFVRSGNRVRPTAEAMAFREEVEQTLAKIGDLSRVAEQIRAGEVGSLTIASHPMAGVTLLPPVVAAFARERPNIKVELFVRNSDLVRGMFPSRSYDIGIAELPVDPSGLAITRYRIGCVAIMPKDHPLTAYDVITPELMSGHPFVGMSRLWTAYHLVEKVFADADAHLNVVASSELFAAICVMVANGIGISIVDRASALQFQSAGLEIRPFRPQVLYDIAVFHAVDPSPSMLARNFLRAFDAHMRTFPTPSEEIG